MSIGREWNAVGFGKWSLCSVRGKQLYCRAEVSDWWVFKLFSSLFLSVVVSPCIAYILGCERHNCCISFALFVVLFH